MVDTKDMEGQTNKGAIMDNQIQILAIESIHKADCMLVDFKYAVEHGMELDEFWTDDAVGKLKKIEETAKNIRYALETQGDRLDAGEGQGRR